MNRQKVILDVDTGTGVTSTDIDDGLAIALALVSPEVELLGCTTCAGNCRTHESTRATLQLLELAQRADIPVAAGREEPLLADMSASLAHFANRKSLWQKYWDDLPPLAEPVTKPSPLKAHEFIIDQVNRYPGEVTIAKEGSLTNLALALLVEPEIAGKIRRVVHMGGTAGAPIWVEDPGSELARLWRYTLRVNTDFDPDATEIVVRSGVPMVFVPPNVTAKVFMRLDDLPQIASGGTPYHQYLSDSSRAWIRFQMDYRQFVGAKMHDPLTLAVVIDPSFCTFAPMHFDMHRFRTRDYPYLVADAPTAQSARVQVAVDVDARRFERFLVERLSSQLPIAPKP